MDKILSNITEIYKEILDNRVVFEQTQKLHLFNGAFCKSGSGPAEHLKSNPTDWTGKRAWDMIAAEGTSVSALDGGTIVSVRDIPYIKGKTEFGRNVTVKTDNDTHYYSNLSTTGPKIQEGGKIIQGDFIGKIGKPQEDPNWGPHLHIALERGDLRNFIEDNCNFKKIVSGTNLTSSGTTSASTNSDVYQKTGLGDVMVKGLKLEGFKKKKINEVTLMAPVPIKPGFKGNFGQVRKGGYIHPGTDIAVPSGTPVKAPLTGKVTNVKANQHPCGGTIDIDYGNGLWSRFCHMKQIDVKEGDIVERGEVVGLSGGATGDYGRGRSSGAHLHFTLKKDGKNVDPKDYMEKFSATDITFDKSSNSTSKDSAISSDDEINYDLSKNDSSGKSIDTSKDSDIVYKKTGISSLLLKPLGFGESEIDEEKVYGEFGKDQKTRYGSITLPKDKNSKIKSPVSGKITRGNYNPSCSNQINILHKVDKNDFVLEYCGIKKPSVQVGDKVNIGTILGQTDTDVTISLFDNTGSRVYIDNYIKKEVEKSTKIYKTERNKEPKLYDSPWGQVLSSILLSPFKAFQDKYDESGELKQKRWSSTTEKIQPDDWISQSSPTYSKKLKEQIERIKKIL